MDATSLHDSLPSFRPEKHRAYIHRVSNDEAAYEFAVYALRISTPSSTCYG